MLRYTVMTGMVLAPYLPASNPRRNVRKAQAPSDLYRAVLLIMRPRETVIERMEGEGVMEYH